MIIWAYNKALKCKECGTSLKGNKLNYCPKCGNPIKKKNKFLFIYLLILLIAYIYVAFIYPYVIVIGGKILTSVSYIMIFGILALIGLKVFKIK